jgi:hypothetical protein
VRWIYLSGEDEVAEALARRCVERVLPELTFQSIRPRQGGIDGVIEKFPSYLDTSRNYPFFVMIDLDRKECPPSARADLLTKHNITDLPRQFILSIVKRESEAWLLGDSDGIAEYLGIPDQGITGNPEELPDPKGAIIQLAKTSPRYRDEICPDAKGDAKVGPGFNFRLTEFVKRQWNIETAAKRSPTIMRTLERLNNLKD